MVKQSWEVDVLFPCEFESRNAVRAPKRDSWEIVLASLPVGDVLANFYFVDSFPAAPIFVQKEPLPYWTTMTSNKSHTVMTHPICQYVFKKNHCTHHHFQLFSDDYHSSRAVKHQTAGPQVSQSGKCYVTLWVSLT